VQLVDEPVAVAAMQCQKHPAVTANIGPDKPGEALPNATGQRVHQKRANEFHCELDEGILEHRPVTMALSGTSAKTGKVSANPMGDG
jgi:hypothetical protein